MVGLPYDPCCSSLFCIETVDCEVQAYSGGGLAPFRKASKGSVNTVYLMLNATFLNEQRSV